MAWNVVTYQAYDNPINATKSVAITEHPNQLLILTLGCADTTDNAIGTATFDGDALTRPPNVNNVNGPDAAVDLKYIDLSGKATGTYNLYYTSSGIPDAGGFAYVIIQGGDGDDLVEDSDGGTGTGATISTSNVTTSDNALQVDVFFCNKNANATPGAGQTQIFQRDPSGTTSTDRMGMSYKVATSAGTNTMSWTSGEEWAHASVAFNLALTDPDVSDTVAIADTPTLDVPVNTIVSDSVGIAESNKMLRESLPGVSDNVSLSEYVDLTVRSGDDLNISIWKDTVAVGEMVEWPGPRDLQVLSEGITITEDVTIKVKKETTDTKPNLKVEY